MAGLIIGPTEKEAIQKLITYANAHPFDIPTMKRMITMNEVAGDDPWFVVKLPMGIKVVYTVEEAISGGHLRHLSVSVQKKGRYAHPAVVNFILAEFGFEHRIPSVDLYVYIEHAAQAVNVVERLSPVTL